MKVNIVDHMETKSQYQLFGLASKLSPLILLSGAFLKQRDKGIIDKVKCM